MTFQSAKYLNDTTLVVPLLEWVSEYAVRAYTTPDSTISYLNHAHGID